MKSKILFSVVFLLLLLGIYSPASYSQTYNLTLQDAVLNGGGTAWSFEVYIIRTGSTPLSVYSFQIGFTDDASSLNGGVLTGAWSNLNSTIVAVENYKAISCTVAGYIKCGFNVNSGGTGAGITIDNVTPFHIGTITLNNSVPFTGFPLVTWYFGGAPGLPTKIQASNGTLAYDVTANGNFGYVDPHGGILPVELSSFTSIAQGRTILLNWSTQTEKNSDKFEIERADLKGNDNLIWTNVGSIKAAVLSNSPKQYSFLDKNLQSGKYQYRLKMIDNNGTFEYSKLIETEVVQPKNFELCQNFPNPFNPSTLINYNLPYDSKVILEVYNITGERICELVNEEQSAGYYSVDFGSSSLSSGVYFYRITAVDKATGNNFSAIKKMILLK
jgi:hypothetical protein